MPSIEEFEAIQTPEDEGEGEDDEATGNLRHRELIYYDNVGLDEPHQWMGNR